MMKISRKTAILLGVALMMQAGVDLAWGAMKEKQTKNPAIVFLVAGQSNAGGCGVYSPELHKELGLDKKRPLNPGTTAKEVGLSTDAADYTHSYIWMPRKGFERLDPMVNTRPEKPGIKNHGMELPVVNRLEKLFPDNDIYVIKYGPNGRSLYEDWNASTKGPCYARLLDWYTNAMAQLSKEYSEVRVIGLYWDQGEADTGHAQEYAGNLKNLIVTFRKDSGLPELKVFIRKHLFGGMGPIVAAQQAVVKEDNKCFLLDIDLGSPEKNDKAWSYSLNNIHLSSKAFVELARILFQDVLKNPEIGSFDLYQPKKE
jgi:Carbohydrate esterase, sialic acid-specific acetylesterase